MSIALRIENLSKEYRLGLIGHGTLYRDLQSFWARILNKEDPNTLIGTNKSKVKGKFLALKNINLEINKGEVLGIIGANGAGKSTLLKIISRVTTPSVGSIKASGKISSLLEIGTGFHFELTGRENIFLNGAINGMSKKEVSKKLDEIVDFAGVETFLDTPVKRYSSGMHVRLGFAVAAHLEPDILVVDEVLAVGDAAFQKKAINKMESVSKDSGRTILFVSHNMEAVRKFCTKTMLLKEGKLTNFGDTNEIVNHYLRGFNVQNNSTSEIFYKKDHNKTFQILRMSIMNHKRANTTLIDRKYPFILSFDYKVLKYADSLQANIAITTHGPQNAVQDDTVVLQWSEQHYNKYKFNNQEVKKDKGVYRVEIDVPGYLLNSGTYKFSVALVYGGSNYEVKKDNIIFNLFDSDSSHALKTGRSAGVLGLPLNWKENKLN